MTDVRQRGSGPGRWGGRLICACVHRPAAQPGGLRRAQQRPGRTSRRRHHVQRRARARDHGPASGLGRMRCAGTAAFALYRTSPSRGAPPRRAAERCPAPDDRRAAVHGVPAVGVRIYAPRQRTLWPVPVILDIPDEVAATAGRGSKTLGLADNPPMGALAVKRACWSAPVTCGRPGLDCCAGFLAAARFRAAARTWVKLSAPAAIAPVRALARTTGLDAGKRRPMIESEEETAGWWVVVGQGVRWMGFRVRVRRSGSHSHPFGRPRGAGP
jgi:hypothetical protein